MTIMARLDPVSCGCDGLGNSPGLTTIDVALDRIRALPVPALGNQILPLTSARDRVLAKPVRAAAPAPPFDNSAMDGYALRSTDLTGSGPWTLHVTARIAAGQSPSSPLDPGAAAQIFTGAPLPLGADSVVMQEHVTRAGDMLGITTRVRPGANIRHAGEDMAMGSIAVPAGCRLGPRDIAACAAAGVATVCVHRDLRIALVLTGDELAAPGSPLAPGHIWDVNGPMLSALMANPGPQHISISHAPDTRAALVRHMLDLAQNVDLIVTSGGISVGAADHVKPALTEAGGEVLLSGVAIKPGKPVSFGRLGPALWLGLPGNPVSAFVIWQLFGRALVDHMTGAISHATRRHVTLTDALRHVPGRCELRPATLSGFDAMGRETVRCAEQTHSARVATLQAADGLLFIPAEIDQLLPSDLVEFLPFD